MLAATAVAVVGPVRAAAQLGDEAGADVDGVQVALDVGRRARRTRRRRCGRRCPSAAAIAANCVGDPAQHGVARGMPVGVVDLLEPVEIDEEHRGAPAGALRVRQGLLDAVDEQRPVRQAGQRVVRRLLGQRGLRVLQVGHPLGLGLAEPGDLAVLGLLGAQVGEREAGEVVAVDLERRAPDQHRDGHAVGVDEVELDGGAEPVRAVDLVQPDRERRRPRTSPAAIRRSSLAGTTTARPVVGWRTG